MQAPVSGWCQVIDGFESFVEAALFFIATAKGDGLDRIIRLQQPSCSAGDALVNNIGMDGRLDQFPKPIL